MKKYSGIDVYTREEIPEELHWAHNEYCPPILILAKVTNLKADEIKEGCVNQAPSEARGVVIGGSEYENCVVCCLTPLTWLDLGLPNFQRVILAWERWF